MIITFDGESGSGKTALAKEIAKNMGFSYISAGLIFRSFTYLYNSPQGDLPQIKKIIDDGHLVYEWDGKDSRIMFFGIDISEDLKKETLGTDTSVLASRSDLFVFMAQMVKDIIEKSGIQSLVVDGRSVGKYLFPNADIKYYITADLHVRAERRTQQLISDQKEIIEMLEVHKKEMHERDIRDRERALFPLEKSPDEREILNQNVAFSEVVAYIINDIRIATEQKIPIK